MDNSTKNLKTSKSAKNFNEWMYSEIKPYLKGDILEVGSGLGTFTEKIVRDFKDSRIILTDNNSEYLESLKKKYGHMDNLDYFGCDWGKPLNSLTIKQVDSIFALNVFEHIENDLVAFENAYNCLRDGGKLIILVPCHEQLFNALDITAEHFRRYSKKEIFDKIETTQFTLVSCFYFNFFSIFGWYINGSLLNKSLLSKSSVSLFDQLVPIFSLIEKYILRKRVGISLIIVLKK